MTRVTLLDGGMGQELVKRHPGPVTSLWGTQVMDEAPGLVREVHAEYLAAGARVVTVNTYTLTRPRLARMGQEHRLAELTATACRLAREAVEAAGQGAIAGSLPPLVGSYRAEVQPPEAEMVAQFAELAALQAPHVDLFICETLSSGVEARAAATAALATGRPVWVSWTLKDGGDAHLRSGETVTEALAALGDLPVGAVLANCCYPESITAAAPQYAAGGRRWGGYANGFTGIDALVPGGTVEVLQARGDLGPAQYADHALRWLDAGATILGGCCETGPAHIAELARRLRDAGHEIVGPEG